MSRERRGHWQEVSRCKECGWIAAKEWKWLSSFFMPVCPNCGKHNSDLMGYSRLFDPVTARRVTSWWGRFLRWEVRNELVDYPRRQT